MKTNSKWPIFAASAFVLAILLLQFTLGEHPAVLVLIGISSAAVIALVVVAPYRFVTFFATLLCFQSFGFVTIYKSCLLMRASQGLLQPLQSFFWGSLLILGAVAIGFVSRSLPSKYCLFPRINTDSEGFLATGVVFYAVGLLASNIMLVAKIQTGAFGPLVDFVTLGQLLIIQETLRRGRWWDAKILFLLTIAILETLLLNAKYVLVFFVAAYSLSLFFSRLSHKTKWVFLFITLVAFAVADQTIFPAVNYVRNNDFRDIPLSQRLGVMYKNMFRATTDWKDTTSQRTSGDIIFENDGFLPGESATLQRFASLGLLDITLEFGQSARSGFTPSEVYHQAIEQAMPSLKSGSKDLTTLSDYLFNEMDPRIPLGGCRTMGCYASARLVFGDWTGFFVTILEWGVIILAIEALCGSDLRLPLVQFFAITVGHVLLEDDVEGLLVFIIRILPQDLLTIYFLGWLGGRLARIIRLSPNAPAARPLVSRAPFPATPVGPVE